MSELPLEALIRELVIQRGQKDLLLFLRGRFGSIPRDLVVAIQSCKTESKLDKALALAIRCPDLKTLCVDLKRGNGKGKKSPKNNRRKRAE